MTVAEDRFYDRFGPLTVSEIAALTGAAISDSGAGDHLVHDVAPLDALAAHTLGYIENAKLLKAAGEIRLDGVVLFAPEELSDGIAATGATHLVHAAPRAAFAQIAGRLYRLLENDGEGAVHPEAQIADSAKVSPFAVIGAGAVIGEGVRIAPYAVIGPGCRVGAGSRIGANASLRCTDLGENCNILAGAVIGEAGFGVAMSKEGAIDVPHLGRVELGDDVTIGANSTIDRGVFGATRLGDRCKIDNLCHIAHNVQVGENVLMAAFAGVSGSTRIGRNVVFGGRVGVADHITIVEDVTVGGAAAVMADITEAGVYAGAPAKPLRQHLREVAEMRRMVKAREAGKKDRK